MIEELTTWGPVTTAVAVALLAALPALPAAADDEAMSGGCVLLSIELEEHDQETLLRIRTDGDPASIGARVEPDQGVVLDLGCTPGPGLSGREFAAGLVSALELDHGAGEMGAPTALTVKIRGDFDYSVRTQPDAVLVSLRAETDPPSGKIRVLEPLPLEDPLPPPLPPASVTPEPQPLDPLAASPPDPRPPAPEPPVPDTSQVVTVIEDWARAWSDQRTGDYLAAYAAAFQPPDGLDRPAWEAQRRNRISAPSWIEVTLGDTLVYFTGSGHAMATFRQSYSSNTFSDEVEKSLTLIREEGRWRILSEAFGRLESPPAPAPEGNASTQVPPSLEIAASQSPEETATAATIVEGARASVRSAPAYDDSYQFIRYPGGDPGREKGSGADLVVRAYRHAGVDLQQRIHQDILAVAEDYGVETPDPHIDHRRIRNLRTFLRRHGRELGTDLAADWRPGDIVFWAIDGRNKPDHLGIVTDRRSPADRLLVIHHEVGGVPGEADVLFAWTIRGHYRWLPAPESAPGSRLSDQRR